MFICDKLSGSTSISHHPLESTVPLLERHKLRGTPQTKGNASRYGPMRHQHGLVNNPPSPPSVPSFTARTGPSPITSCIHSTTHSHATCNARGGRIARKTSESNSLGRVTETPNAPEQKKAKELNGTWHETYPLERRALECTRLLQTVPVSLAVCTRG